MTVMSFTATAHRSQGWWALEVTGGELPYPAHTQSSRLDQAEAMVRDLLALHFGMSTDQTGEITIVPVLDPPLSDEVSKTRRARQQAEKLRAEAVYQTRQTARNLKAQGLAQRDISVLLGVSHQAISQILTS